MLDLKAIFSPDENAPPSVPPYRPRAVATITPEDLPWEWREEWEERAAIREYEGGQAREHAEAEVLAEIVGRMRMVGVGPCGNT